MLKLSGKTTGGKLVVCGIYRLHETSGIPIDVILEGLHTHNYMPDWQSFIVEAVEAGMSVKRAISKLEPAISDVFGPELRIIVAERLGTAIPADEAYRKNKS